MKRLHIKCERPEGSLFGRGVSPFKDENGKPVKNVFISGVWDFKPEDMESLIGGGFYLHTTKNDKSYFGGKVLEIIPQKLGSKYENEYYKPKLPEDDDPGRHSDRIMFKVEFDRSYIGVEWEGKDHVMSWCGGIVGE